MIHDLRRAATRMLFATLLATTAFHPTISASAAPCRRVNNSLDLCDTSPSAPGCEGQPASRRRPMPTWKQWLEFYRWLYSEAPPVGASAAQTKPYLLAGCVKYFAKTKDLYEGYDGAIDVWVDPNFPETGICLADAGWDDENDTDETPTDYVQDVVVETNITKDDCCSRTPRGPYEGLKGGGSTEGGTFSDTLKMNAVSFNQSLPHHNGVIWSDAAAWRDIPDQHLPPRPAGTGADFYRDLSYRAGLLAMDDDDPNARLKGKYPPHAAELDHIIPRVDSKGCECGTNSAANAALISRQLNGKMSNSCLNSERERMLERWAPLPP